MVLLSHKSTKITDFKCNLQHLKKQNLVLKFISEHKYKPLKQIKIAANIEMQKILKLKMKKKSTT